MSEAIKLIGYRVSEMVEFVGEQRALDSGELKYRRYYRAVEIGTKATIHPKERYQKGGLTKKWGQKTNDELRTPNNQGCGSIHNLPPRKRESGPTRERRGSAPIFANVCTNSTKEEETQRSPTRMR